MIRSMRRTGGSVVETVKRRMRMRQNMVRVGVRLGR
jgi:hypothetical protein